MKRLIVTAAFLAGALGLMLALNHTRAVPDDCDDPVEGPSFPKKAPCPVASPSPKPQPAPIPAPCPTPHPYIIPGRPEPW